MTDVLPRRRANTRQRLLDAALEVFVEEGFGGASIEMIAERAGFTRGAFYSNFGSKEELFVELTKEQLDLRLQRAVAAFAGLRGQLVQRAVINTRAVGQLLASTLSDPESERQWHILYSEAELFALRNPALGSLIIEFDEQYQEEVIRAITPMMDAIGMRFAGDPQPIMRMLITAYLSLERGAFLSPDLDFEQALRRQTTWFTQMLDLVVEPTD